MVNCHGWLGFIATVIITTSAGSHARGFTARPKKVRADFHTENRIILRYKRSGDKTLKARVEQLVTLHQVKDAHALSALDMAVVVLHPHADEESLLELLQAQEGVEMAVPDTWVQAFSGKPDEKAPPNEQTNCSANPGCTHLSGQCCPAADGMRLACCDVKVSETDDENVSTISLLSVGGGYLAAYSDGSVQLTKNNHSPYSRLRLVSNKDGTVSFRSHHGQYLTVEKSNMVTADRDVAGDWEKFRIKYNSDGTISIRSYSGSFIVVDRAGNFRASTDDATIQYTQKFQVFYRHGLDQRVPDDSNFTELWGMDHFANRDIDAPEAWELFSGADVSRSIVVAVIDTGIDYTHPELKHQMWVNPGEIPGNGIDDDGNGFVDDVHGADFANNDGDPFDDQMHGTHVSGTIAGAGNNSFGVAGVAWAGVQLMACKFLTSSGGGKTSDAIRAIDYAVAMGAQVASNSWGGQGSSSALRVAIERASAAGVLFVAAAGNDGTDNDELPQFPANYESANIISVASTTKEGELSDFSCYGQLSVHVAAPGSDIFSTTPGGTYDTLSGTSMATPHVSGLSALVWMYRPHLAMDQIKDIILKSAVKEDVLRGSSMTNARINAFNALKLAASYEEPRPPVNSPLKLEFKDIDPTVQRIKGTAVITAPSEQADIEYFEVFFISKAGFFLGSLGKVNATGEETVKMVMNDSITIPSYAGGLVAVAGNSTGESSASSGAKSPLEDYGVPKEGPESATWGGDYDSLAGRIAGSIFVKRAPDETTVSHYNAYWRTLAGERGKLLGSLPATGFLKPQCGGDSCGLIVNTTRAHDGAVVFTRTNYTGEEYAEIYFSGPARLTVTAFDTERHYDTLDLSSQVLSGSTVELPLVMEFPAGPVVITWSSDNSENRDGWSFALLQLDAVAEIAIDDTVFDERNVEVVAAYNKWELLPGVITPLSDFDSSKMPPSSAFLPSSVTFNDTDVSAGIIAGEIVIHPSKAAKDSEVLKFYQVILVDSERKQVGTEKWLIDAKISPLSVILSSLTLPPTASGFLVQAGNSQGLTSSSKFVDILDVIRNPPMAASFSGDEDDREDIIKGDLTIVPALDQTGILGYAVYLVNGTEKQKLLGRAKSKETGNVSFRVAAMVEEGQNLLVVSYYIDGEMDTGISVEIEDFYQEESYEDYPPEGQWPYLQLEATSDKHPPKNEPRPSQNFWTRRSHPAWNETQDLWRASFAHQAGGDNLHATFARIRATLTMPGILRPSGADFEEFEAPSTEQRSAIIDALLESLPGLQEGSLNLNRGIALTGASARAGAVRLTGAGRKLNIDVEKALNVHSASLAVDFEIVALREVEEKVDVHAFLDQVEARLILLSRGGRPAAHFDQLLASKLLSAGAMVPLTFRTLLSEPQQIRPRSPSHGGRVLSSTVFVDSSISIEEELQESQGVVSGLIALLLAGGLFSCGAVTVLRRRQLRRDVLTATIAEAEAADDDFVSLDAVTVQTYPED